MEFRVDGKPDDKINEQIQSPWFNRLEMCIRDRHLAGLQARQADFLLHTGNHHDQPLFHNLIARSGEVLEQLLTLAATSKDVYKRQS